MQPQPLGYPGIVEFSGVDNPAPKMSERESDFVLKSLPLYGGELAGGSISTILTTPCDSDFLRRANKLATLGIAVHSAQPHKPL